MNEKLTFDALAKVSSVDRQADSPAGRAYEKLFAAINSDSKPLIRQIEESGYPRKSELKDALDQILSMADLFLRYPFLTGRTSVGIVSGKSPVGLRVLDQLQNSGRRAAYGKQWDVPCVVYDSIVPGQIMATNRAGQVMRLTQEQFGEICSIYRHDLNVRDMVASYAISASLGYPRINYVLFPRYADKSTQEFARLAELCDLFCIIYEKNSGTEGLADTIKNSAAPIYIVSGDNAEAENKFRIDLVRQCPGRNIHVISEAQLSQVLEEYDHFRHNTFLGDRFRAALLPMQVWRCSAICKHITNINALAKDSLFSEDIGSEIAKFRKNEIGFREREEELKCEFEQKMQEIVGLAAEFEKSLREMTSPTVDEDGVEKQFSFYYGETCGQIILQSLQCEDNQTAEYYLSKLKKANCDLLPLYRLYYHEAVGKSLLRKDLEWLQWQEGTDDSSQEIIRGLFHFAGEIRISENERCKLAYRLKERSAEEAYYHAQYVESKAGADRARADYEKAFELGSTSAAAWLTEYYENTHDSYQVKKLADSLIPQAAFLYGKQCLSPCAGEKVRYAQGITYLRVAVSLKYVPAILYYADMLYLEVHEQRNPANIDVVIKLYLFIYQNKLYAGDVVPRIGILYHIKEDFGNARKYLEMEPHSGEVCCRLGCIYRQGSGVARDFGKARRYLEEAKRMGYSEADEQLRLLKRQESYQKSKERSDHETYHQAADYKSQITSGSTSSSCFITTATCQFQGKPDDCEELTAFRRYRDETLIKTETGQALVKEYYRIAPKIVERIDEDDDCGKIYQYLYDNFIRPGYQLLLDGRGEEAACLYEKGVRLLAQKYAIAFHAL